MQVYAALYDNSGLILLAKKREFNNWWKLTGNAKSGGPPRLLNQAGQWCLPGGAQDSDNLIDAAKREFREETGHPFPPHAVSHIEQWIPQDFAMVCFRVADALALEEAIDPGLKPNPSNQLAPVNVNIDDWELGEVSVVAKSVVHNFLGAALPVSAAAAAKRTTAKPHSQSIDWYAQMAAFLRANI